MKISFNPSNSNKNILDLIKNNKDIIFDLKGHSIFARGVEFKGTDTNTWRDIKINNVSIGSHTLDLRNGSNTTLTNTNGVVTINSTWRPVVDNLTSDSTTSSLSAKQGKVLKALIDGKSNSDHNHDGRYVRYYAVTTLDCNNLAAGLTAARISATNAAHTNHSAYLYISDVGTPFQIQIPDSSIPYIYKRCYGSGGWSGWFKLNAGYADSAGSVAWANVTGKPSSYTPSAHTHAWNSLTHSSTTENQAILTNGKANGWKLQTLNIARWDNAANNAHSHANKSVLDGITSALVNSWNTAYNFVSNITGTDTDKVINKWEEIVNFLAGITEDNKLNTLLNSKLSIQQLSAKDILTTKTNNALFWVDTKGNASTITTGPFTDHPYALLSVTNYNQNAENHKFFYRSRLAFNSAGDIKVASCHHEYEYQQDETWYNVLTSKNSGISGSTIKLNGTSITVYSSGTADGRYVKKSGDTMQGVLTIDTTNFGALTIKRNDDANGASIQFRGKSSVYGYIGLNNSTKDKQFLRWSSDTSRVYTILDTSSTYISNGKGVINGTTITQVDNATNSTNSTNARKLVNWYSARPTSLNAQFGDGSLRIFYATSSTTEGKPAEDSHILHLAWDNTGGYDAQLAVHTRSGKVSTRAQNGGTWQPWKTLAFTTDIPSSLKNPYSFNVFGVVYDGSAAKTVTTSNFISQVNEGTSTITDGTMLITSWASNSGFADTNAVNVPYKRKAIHLWEYIKAKTDSLYATKGHNHDGRYVYNYGGTQMDGASINKNALGMATNSGITGDWWHILQAAWNGEYRWNSQIAFPTQNRNGMYYRSGLDDNTKWGSWVKLLDVNNYSSTLDSRYYTESEVNSLLDAKLNRQNLSYGTWNPRGYHLAADYQYNGGDLSISESGGKIHVSVDGYFWQNEGQYRVLDTSDVASLKGDLTVHQYLSATDTTWWPLIWGGSSHANTSDSTGAVYKSYDKLSWQTSSQTLYATNIQTNNIKNLSIGGGIYWNPNVESASDGSDAASITLVRSGVAGGTTLVLSQMNDTNDTIQFKTNTAARLYHNNYPILTTQNTYVSNNKGYINGTEITQVNNSDTLDGYHETKFFRHRGNTNKNESPLKYTGGTLEYYGNLPSGMNNVYTWGGSLVSGGEITSLQFYYPDPANDKSIYARTFWDNNDSGWHKLAFTDSKVADSDKLDGVHLNGIFTGFSYAQSRLTATIGTVSKTVNVTGSYPSIGGVTMNTIASYGNCMGMADLASSNSNVNPNNQTSWHHFINMSYNTESTNMWQTQFAIKAGTTEVWVRSRAGGSISDSSAWAAPWVRLARITDNIASATNADMVDGYHATDGRTFNGDINWGSWHDVWSDGTHTHPWYGFDHRYPNTGAYSTTISDYFGMTIKTYNTLLLDCGTLLLNSRDNVGIGTTSPTQKLDVAGNIRATGQIIREGSSQLWVNGRNGALLRETSVVGYHTLWSLKTTDGSWDFGEYHINSNWNNIPVLSYVTDSNYNSGNNATTYQIKFPLASGTVALTSNIPNPTNYYWANVKISTSSSTTTSPTVSNLTATNSIKMSNILLEHTDEINNITNAGIHLNYRNSGNVSLCYGGGNVSIGNRVPSYKLDVAGQMRASGFHHESVNSDNYILLAGGGYKSFGGDESHPIFLGYLNLDHGNDGTVSSSFPCLGYSVPFTYTRGGNYCRIIIPNTTHLSFYVKAATASVNYSGGGMDTWVGHHRSSGAWWLHCYAYGWQEVRVKGFRLANNNNDSWWGGNPLYSDYGGANRITVCLFGYVKFK